MRFTKLRAAILVLIALLLFTAVFQAILLEERRQGAIQTSGALCASTGNLVKILLSNVGAIEAEDSVTSRLKESIRQQSLIILTLGVDVSQFDANAFEGICEIVARKDLLFPLSSTATVIGVRDNFLNSKFADMRRVILSEALVRSARIADAHHCAVRP
jgi:hypothetical protein